MKTIFLCIAGLFLINQTMAQCTGGSIINGNSQICVGTTTGIMEVTGYSGTIDQWEYSTDGGSNWYYAGSTSYQHSDVLTTTGTYSYRVKIVNSSNTCYSSTQTIEVKNADGGTISAGGGTFCSGTTITALNLTGQFIGSGNLFWEYSTDGGSTFAVDGSGTNTNPYTPSLSTVGTYIYRAKASCGSSADDISSNTKTYQVNSATAAAVCDDADDLRKAVAKVHISMTGSTIPDFSGFLVNHTSQDGRLLFLTTSQPFVRFSPSSSDLHAATFTWNEDLSSCGGSAATTTTSTGCTLLVTDGFFTLLELDAAPALSELYYLGWDYGASGNCNSIFQSAAGIKKGKVSTGSSPTAVSGSFTSGTDDFVESSGTGVFKVSSWSSGNTEKRGRGAPLLAGSVGKKVRGVYIGGDEVSCGNGPSYFAELHSGLTSLLGYLRDGSESNTATVHMNYCKPSQNLNYVQDYDWTYQVTGSIVSTQPIQNGYVVRYKAGTFVELNDGFVSGTDFVAEIDPCVITVTTIAAKTDNEKYEETQNTSILTEGSKIKIYPTVIGSGNAVNIEVTEALPNLSISIFDLQGNEVQQTTLYELNALQPYTLRLRTLSSGLYVVKAYNHSISLTQKIIIQ